MSESNSEPYTVPAPPGTPSREEDRRRMAFQMLHPEVGFVWRARPEPHWLSYWWDSKQGKPQHREAVTLGDLVGEGGILESLFADTDGVAASEYAAHPLECS